MSKSRLPNGLMLFRPGSSPLYRKRRVIFLVGGLFIGLMLIWPLYPIFDGAEPGLFGLPISLTSVVLTLLAMLALLVWLYRTDHAN